MTAVHYHPREGIGPQPHGAARNRDDIGPAFRPDGAQIAADQAKTGDRRKTSLNSFERSAVQPRIVFDHRPDPFLNQVRTLPSNHRVEHRNGEGHDEDRRKHAEKDKDGQHPPESETPGPADGPEEAPSGSPNH